MIWFPERLPDEVITPFRVGDLILLSLGAPVPAIFMGLLWMEHDNELSDPDGWIVMVSVYTPHSGVCHQSWEYIESCKLLSSAGGSSAY